MCESMKWNHLPAPGGLAAQHPDLLDGFQLIFAKRAEYEEQKRKEEEAKRTKQQAKAKNPGRGRRR